MQSFEALTGIELPHSPEAEASVLGAILIDPMALEAVETLSADAFYETGNRLIYEAAMELGEECEPIDIVTLAQRLDLQKRLADVGGVQYLSRLAGSVPTSANVEYYAGILRDKHMLRQVIQAGMKQIREASENGDAQAAITQMQVAAARLSDQSAPTKEFIRVRDVVIQVYESLEERYANRDNGGIPGIESGFTDLDKMTAGFQKSDLIIVAARPSVGKTAFALNIAQNVAVRSKETVAIFSLEMSAPQLVQRMISAEGNVDASKIRTGNFEIGDWEKTAAAVSYIGESNILIDDTPDITVHEIRNKCRRLKKQEGLGLVVIDYLQLIAGSRKRGENRQQEVSEISRTLKQMARELEVPVIALSQLSRGVEQRQDKRPMMSDLRESGSIEQDADVVAFLYRDDYYDQESEKKNIIEIIIAKQRNGPVGTVELVFLKNFNKFVNYDRRST